MPEGAYLQPDVEAGACSNGEGAKQSNDSSPHKFGSLKDLM